MRAHGRSSRCCRSLLRATILCAAARFGLDALRWVGRRRVRLRRSSGLALLDTATGGLSAAGLGQSEVARWLDVIRDRSSATTGAVLTGRFAWIARHGRDFHGALVDAYVRHQADNTPVHEWSLT